MARGRHLRRPLGAWLRFDDTWPWYLTPEGALYKRQAGNWYYHPVLVKRLRLPAFSVEGILSTKPETVLRATIYEK